MTRKYTMSKLAYAARKKASIKAAAVRPAGRVWRTVRIDSATLEKIEAARRDGESLNDVIGKHF